MALQNTASLGVVAPISRVTRQPITFEYEPKHASSTDAQCKKPTKWGDGGNDPHQYSLGSKSSPWLIVLDWGHMYVWQWRFKSCDGYR